MRGRALLRGSAAVSTALVPTALKAVPPDMASEPETNILANLVFLAFVLITFFITWQAAKKSRSREAFLTAGGNISSAQNGFALAGDFMSAATLLGITSLVFFRGVDGLVLTFPVIVGWTMALILVAEKLRNLGKFTFVDVIAYRFEGQAVRMLLVLSSLIVILFYLIGQMVGAGKLIELLFGIKYHFAVALVSAMMIVYVYFGGMIATTWVQMIKAALLLIGGALIAVLTLSVFNFDFSLLLNQAASKHSLGQAISAPGGWLEGDPVNVWTVGLTMAFGIMGLPHILMRFLTVRDGVSARLSAGYATSIIALFYVLVAIIGFGSIALIWENPEYYNASGQLLGGGNMVALHAANAVGGSALLGFMSAVAFATILAVVAGLTLSGAAAIAHDLYGVAIKRGQGDPQTELKISRISILGFGLASIILGILFEQQNIAVIVATALAIAASVNFPLLVLAIYWRGLTSRGALFGGGVTLAVSLFLIILSEGFWVQILGNPEPLFPYVYPTVFTLPLGFVLVIAFSKLDRSESSKAERGRFTQQQIRAETGLGAVDVIEH